MLLILSDLSTKVQAWEVNQEEPDHLTRVFYLIELLTPDSVFNITSYCSCGVDCVGDERGVSYEDARECFIRVCEGSYLPSYWTKISSREAVGADQ